MSDDQQGQEERELRAYFDETAEPPGTHLLTRLAARALDVPKAPAAAGNSGAFRLPSWALALSAVAVGMGTAVLLRQQPASRAQPAESAPARQNAGPSELGSQTASASPLGPQPSRPAGAAGSVDEQDFELEGASAADEWFDVGEPSDDTELDAWLRATRSLKAGG